MSMPDIVVIAAIAGAAVLAAVRLKKTGVSCGACENCPGSIYCKKKKN